MNTRGSYGGSALRRMLATPSGVAMLLVASLVVCGGAASAGRAATRVDPFTGGDGPVWSPDGTQIAYIGPAPSDVMSVKTQVFTQLLGLDHVFVVAADGSGLPNVVATAPRGEILDQLGWAAGGVLVYADSNYTLWSVDPPRKTVTRLGTDGTTSGEVFALSPNGREVAFTAPCNCNVPLGTAVDLVGVSGGRVRALPRPSGALDSGPSFSPDGTQVVFTRVRTDETAAHRPPNGSLVVADVRGGQQRSIDVDGTWPAFSPNGRWIAFFAAGGLEIVLAAGGTPRLLVPFRYVEGLASYSWSPSSNEIAYDTGQKIGTVTLAGSTTRFSLPALDPTPGGAADPPQWSPDGRSIAFSASAKTEGSWSRAGGVVRLDEHEIRVYVIGAEGTGMRRLA